MVLQKMKFVISQWSNIKLKTSHYNAFNLSTKKSEIKRKKIIKTDRSHSTVSKNFQLECPPVCFGSLYGIPIFNNVESTSFWSILCFVPPAIVSEVKFTIFLLGTHPHLVHAHMLYSTQPLCCLCFGSALLCSTLLRSYFIHINQNGIVICAVFLLGSFFLQNLIPLRNVQRIRLLQMIFHLPLSVTII